MLTIKIKTNESVWPYLRHTSSNIFDETLYFLNCQITAPMVQWSKALQLTARYFSPLPGFEFRPGHMGKLLVTRLGGGFHRILRFPLRFTNASSGFSLIKTETGMIIV